MKTGKRIIITEFYISFYYIFFNVSIIIIYKHKEINI